MFVRGKFLAEWQEVVALPATLINATTTYKDI